MFWVCKLKLEEVVIQGNHDLQCHLRECLTEANTTTAQKGHEGERTSFAAIRLFVPVALRVESIGLEESRFFPLHWIITDEFDANVEGFTS